MLTKIEKIEEFVQQWQDTHEQEKKLATLYSGLVKTKDVSFYGEFQVNGEKFVLHELMNSTEHELADTMDEELLSILTFLQMENQTKQKNLVESLTFLNVRSEEESTSPVDRNVASDDSVNKDTSSKTRNFFGHLGSQPLKSKPHSEEEPKQHVVTDEPIVVSIESSEKSFKEIMDIAIKLQEKPIIIPNQLYDTWFANHEEYTVGDVHEYLRNLVNMGQLTKVNYISCYKCNNFEKHFTTIPRDITCGNCLEDIVNVEIHYKKK